MSFVQGLSGLFAAAKNLDVIGNNVANASTVGFKGSDVIFADVYANSLNAGGRTAAGSGVGVASVQQSFAQGNVKTTSNPLDVAINGSGFFRLDTNGTVSYSRNGQFHVDDSGYIVNATGSRVTGYGVDSTGAVLTAGIGPLQVPLTPIAARPTATASIGVNLDARKPIITGTFDPTIPSTYTNSTSMEVYDSLGVAHAYNSYYVKTAANTWSVYGTIDGAALAAPIGALTFDTDGTLLNSAPALPLPVSATLAAGPATPLVFTLDYPGVTQFGSDFAVTSLDQDGHASGSLTGFAIGDDGTLLGRYTNGETSKIGQMLLVNFANANGLQPMGNNAWAETITSGQAIAGVPGTGTLGELKSGAVEESNVDLTEALVDMITAQRSYQASAQTIKTQDQLLNTLVNMR